MTTIAKKKISSYTSQTTYYKKQKIAAKEYRSMAAEITKALDSYIAAYEKQHGKIKIYRLHAMIEEKTKVTAKWVKSFTLEHPDGEKVEVQVIDIDGQKIQFINDPTGDIIQNGSGVNAPAKMLFDAAKIANVERGKEITVTTVHSASSYGISVILIDGEIVDY